MENNRKFVGRWDSYEEMVRDFFPSYGRSALPPANMPAETAIIIAAYGGGSYDGTAFVLFRQDGQLREVNGGHCSCNGLEEQWEPEDTTLEAVKKRKFDGYEFDTEEIAAIGNAIATLNVEVPVGR